MVDAFELPEPMQPTKLAGVELVAFVGIGADEIVFTGIADEDFIDIADEHLADPISHWSLLQAQAFMLGFHPHHMADQLRFAGLETLFAQIAALVIHASQHAMPGMHVQTQIDDVFHSGFKVPPEPILFLQIFLAGKRLLPKTSLLK